ncbi:MAG TPA: GNAT family N-acetyltransferase [Pyrinomonadaceae bacterium]
MTAPLLQFVTLTLPGSGTLPGLSVSLASSRSDRQHAIELRRDIYRRKGLLREDILTPPVLPQACSPGSAIFVAKEYSTIVGTISFYMDSPIGLPMDEVHGDEVDKMRGRFERVAEVGGLAVLEDRRGVGITMMLYLATFRWALATETKYIVACVNPSSRRAYRKLLLFEVLGECKKHPRFLDAPSIPIGVDLSAHLEHYRETRGKPDNDSHKFFRDTEPVQTYADLGAAHYLQWSDDEVSEMIRTRQLALAGNDLLHIERHYSTNTMAHSPT